MIVHNPPYQGGIVQYCTLLANNLKNRIELETIGFKSLYPKFLYKGELPKESTLGISSLVQRYDVIRWYNPLSWIMAYKIAKSFDVLHLHWVSPLLAPIYYTILKLNQLHAKKPVVMTLHNIQPHESTFFDELFTKAVFSKVNEFVVHAKENKTRLASRYGISPDHIHVIPHGSFDYFTKWNNNSLTFGGKKVILFFGYIREYKGLAYLLRAMEYVLKKEPDTILLIAGELWGSWEPYQKIIDDLEINRESIVTHLKYIPDKDVHKYFNAADVVCLPYYNTEQTISGPLLISFAFGKPTIISNVGGISELVEHEENGLLVEGGNVTELSKSILKLLGDEELRKKLGENARKSVQRMGWDRIAEQYCEAYKKFNGGDKVSKLQDNR